MKSAESHLEIGDRHSDDDESLVEGCRIGERNAQQRLYEQYGGKVFSLMVRMVGRQEAIDLTQQVFLQVYRKIHQFSGKSKLGTWLYRVAVNEALQYQRRKKNRDFQPLLFEPANDSSRSCAYENKETLEHALACIAPDLRAILLLREIDQLSYSQLAEILEIPAGTVASRLNRARSELKMALASLDE